MLPISLIAGTQALKADIAEYPQGIIAVVNKPYRWTSADVVRKIKYAACNFFGKKNLKVGHAGTLDPLATGVLLICIGNATKLAEDLKRGQKEYYAAVTFGATTPSYDLEKEIDAEYAYSHITAQGVAEILPNFLGEQEQVAPLFSAKSADGVRAYEIARKIDKQRYSSLFIERDVLGLPKPIIKDRLEETAEALLTKQQITISELELLDFATNKEISSLSKGSIYYDDREVSVRNRINLCDYRHLALPTASLRIVCSKGTYVRAFARDLGEAMDSGAYLSGLIRTVNGDFNLKEALTLEQVLSYFTHN